MPQGLTKFLTQDEVIDLAKFISELGKPGPYAMRKIPNIQRWQVMQEPSAELTSEIPHLENIRSLVLDSVPEQWSSAYGQVSGALPLAELRLGELPLVLILQGEVQVNEAGSISFQVKTTEKFQAWLDDQPMDSKTEFESNLAAGRHRLTLRVEVGVGENPELKVEVSKSVDSKLQFEVVGFGTMHFATIIIFAALAYGYSAELVKRQPSTGLRAVV